MSRTDESVLASLAKALAPGGWISIGHHAALRRMNPLAPGAAAMTVYRVLEEQEVPLQDPALMQRWSLLIHALALARGAHETKIPIGKALWEMGYTEQRINQLLVAGSDMLSQLIPRLARRLQSSGGRMDFTPLMRLVLTAERHEERAENARLEIARSYARHQPKE